MSDVNWKDAPEGAETYERYLGGGFRWRKPGFYFGVAVEDWMPTNGAGWEVIETRPESERKIIKPKDMKEGMVVRCVRADCSWYKEGDEYKIGNDGDYLGPLDEVDEVAPNLEDYTFELVSEPERKTVKDAWEYYNGTWPGLDNLYFNTDAGDWGHDNSATMWAARTHYQVCTREEFEAYGREQEAWTHIDEQGDPCYVKCGEPDRDGYIVIVSKSVGYMLVNAPDIKPIPTKPTISKSEAWDKAVLSGNMSHITDNFEVK